MDIIIQSTLRTLQKAHYILANLSDEQLSNTSVPPYYSSIGSHVRHILDFYNCILNRDVNNRIDLTSRCRNREVENCCNQALDYLNNIMEELKILCDSLNEMVIVMDDLGLGNIEMTYTLAAAFSQANSHTIHHYAIINYILDGLQINLEDSELGFNPTTPKNTMHN